ncbi:hypothetical protein [Streptosporangium roseum]|uniref:hypothetical protein n=1 Tax=Streptosporangium roseum TaxID=2001 RepID=UPI00333375B3
MTGRAVRGYMVGRELQVDQVSLSGAGQRMREPVDLFGQHTDALLKAVAGGGRSPWGIGVIGMVMDQINETLAQACGHLHANLDMTGTGVREMGDQARATELLTMATVQDLDPSTR